MFIVARRKGQRIVIGNDIEVVVTELSRSTVKLGILAPKPCLILRGEVRDSIVEANRAAITGGAESLPSIEAEPSSPELLETRLSHARDFLGTSAVKKLPQENVNPETPR